MSFWQPDEVIDDSTLASLDASLGFIGMQEEVKNLNDCKTGEAMTEAQVQSLKKRLSNLRIIPCRWVSAFKSADRVRCRIVAKDVRRGTSARSLGFSSPTPSIEGLHCVLTLAANRNYRLCSMDIAHAFMHSPIPRGTAQTRKETLRSKFLSSKLYTDSKRTSRQRLRKLRI